MRIVKLSQSEDREAWLQYRLGKATGSKAKGLKPLTRGADRTPTGFWQLLAEKVAVPADGEKAEDRGQRLENEALERTAKSFKLKLNLDPGMWVSDEDEDLAVSPDGAEKGDKPTYAAEAKCLSSSKHLKYVIKDKRAQLSGDYIPINSIPNEGSDSFKEQVIQYFVVNEDLNTLYFTLYDDRIAIDAFAHHVIVIKREDIEELVEEQKTMQLETLEEINQMVMEMGLAL